MSDDLPDGWSAVPLGTLLDGIETGSSFKCDERPPNEHETGVLRISAVTWGEYDEAESKTCMDPTRIDERALVREGDFLLSRANTIELVGAAVIAKSVTRRLMLSDKILRLRFGPGVLPEWALRYLRTPEGRRQLEEASTGNQLSMRNIPQERLRAISLPVAPLNEQRRIVAKLEDLLARSRRAKEALDAIPPLLETLRRSILAAAFRGDLTADWRAKQPDIEPADRLLARIRMERRKKWEEAELARLRAKGKAPTDDRWKEKYREPERVDATELPDLPGGWAWAGLSELSEIQLGQQRAPVHTSAEVMLPYVRAANITWNGLDLSDVKEMGFPDPERYLLRPGDVLLSEASGSASEVGKPAIWRGEIEGCCYQKTLLRVRPMSRHADSEWLHLAFLHDALNGHFAAMAPGVGILHLTAERMLNWPVPLAPAEEQFQIIARSNGALRAARKHESLVVEMLAGLPNADAAVLAKAFRGELVPQDPNDEPADVMLARFRDANEAPLEGGSRERPSGVRTARRKKGAA